MNTFLKDKDEDFFILMDYEKKNFLDKYVRIDAGHWGGWHIVSYPHVNAITFDKDMKHALIDYRRDNSSGGEALLKKEGDTWIFVDDILFWIE